MSYPNPPPSASPCETPAERARWMRVYCKFRKECAKIRKANGNDKPVTKKHRKQKESHTNFFVTQVTMLVTCPDKIKFGLGDGKGTRESQTCEYTAFVNNTPDEIEMPFAGLLRRHNTTVTITPCGNFSTRTPDGKRLYQYCLTSPGSWINWRKNGFRTHELVLRHDGVPPLQIKKRASLELMVHD